MKNHLPSLATVSLATSFSFGATPSTIEIGATAPSGLGGHLAVSSFLGESLFLQARLEEGALPFGPKLGMLHHGLAGIGYEKEYSSLLFFRLTAGAGVGVVYAPTSAYDGRANWLQTLRIAPEIDWFPFGRFRDIPVGLNLGLNLQHRSGLSGNSVMGGLSGQSAQIFAGLVL